jgi:hypothetical protein
MEILTAALLLLSAQDWPTVRGNPERTGAIEATWPPGKPARIWVRHFANERLGSAMEPIVGNGLVFVATHSGNVYALKADTGDPVWRYVVGSPILHSPVLADGKVHVAPTEDRIHQIDAATGVGYPISYQSTFAASPLATDGVLFAGSRSGVLVFQGGDAGKGSGGIGVPIRQTAAGAEGRLYVTGEDLRVRSFDLKTRAVLWTSEPLQGQSARDFYPVIVRAGGKNYVVVRTNPVIHHPDRLAKDFQFLCRNAGVESHWKKVDEWSKSDQARGTPELWEKEQAAVVKYLEERPEARTFFVLDAETGKEVSVPPVLWIGGCQGVGTPPVVLPDGRLIVFYRTAYTNWNHGVAPFVALGALDLARNRIVPWFHENGKQPPWNMFWGTADEAQNFVLAGPSLIIVHQSTLSRFDLNTRKLETLAGDRDGWGGYRNLPWAMNEWNGPARGGVAISGKRMFWITGSRIHAFEAGVTAKPAEDVEIDGSKVAENTPKEDFQKAAVRRNEMAAYRADALRQPLGWRVEEVVSRRWAPLYVQQGIAGREFFFDETSELFESLARAYRHLEPAMQKRVKDHLAAEWSARPPFSKDAWLSLTEGERREYAPVPKEVLTRAGHPKPHHPFGGVYAACLYAERCGEEERLRAAWPQIKSSFDDFAKSWKPERSLRLNRYLASLMAFSKLAAKMDDAEAAKRAEAMAEESAAMLIAWWKAAVERTSLRVFKNISELDHFIGKGDDGLFFRVIPHNHKMALFYDLTPEVAARVRRDAPEAADRIWKLFESLCATWWLVGEERQVHYGENFVDPPDFARDAFAAAAWIGNAPRDVLTRRVDEPFARADLTYLRKIAIALDPK